MTTLFLAAFRYIAQNHQSSTIFISLILKINTPACSIYIINQANPNIVGQSTSICFPNLNSKLELRLNISIGGLDKDSVYSTRVLQHQQALELRLHLDPLMQGSPLFRLVKQLFKMNISTNMVVQTPSLGGWLTIFNQHYLFRGLLYQALI